MLHGLDSIGSIEALVVADNIQTNICLDALIYILVTLDTHQSLQCVKGSKELQEIAFTGFYVVVNRWVTWFDGF